MTPSQTLDALLAAERAIAKVERHAPAAGVLYDLRQLSATLEAHVRNRLRTPSRRKRAKDVKP